MIDELLDIAWPRGVPPGLDHLVDRALCRSLLREFKLGLILSCGPAAMQDGPAEHRPTRLALSDQGEDRRWQQRVLGQWPSRNAVAFLAQAAPATRRMVDSDGSDRAVLYLDDLQTATHDLIPPAPLRRLELMCATLSLPDEQPGWLTRHEELPLELLGAGLRRHGRDLLDLGARGLWSVRWRDAEAQAVLWITESRWRDNAERTNDVLHRLLQARGAPEGLLDTLRGLGACVAAHRHHIYPDAVELLDNGSIDITLGFL